MRRSLLFIPGDSEKKLGKAASLPADALILDLEDSVTDANKAAARSLVADVLAAMPATDRGRYWVRINPLDGPLWRDDLDAVGPVCPAGVMLPKASGAADVVRLAAALDELEARHGLAAGTIAVLPIATETPAAVFALGSYADGAPRLAGLTWGAEDLSAALGASTTRDADGRFSEPYRLARTLTLLAAHAAGVEAIETLHADYRDLDGLRAAAQAARRDGFTGMLAIHPSQVEVINAAFVPEADEVEWARRVVAAFAEPGAAGTVGMNGSMLDVPHLKRARRILQAFEALSGKTN